MKKIIAAILLLISLSFISLFAYKIIKTQKRKEEANESTKTLPEFYFLTEEGFPFTRDSLKSKKIIINYFSPSCEHCQYMTQEFIKHRSQLLNKEIIMVTAASRQEVDSFRHVFNLQSMENIHTVLDTAYTFNKIFGAVAIPSFFIYNDNVLQKKIIGETKIENLLTP